MVMEMYDREMLKEKKRRRVDEIGRLSNIEVDEEVKYRHMNRIKSTIFSLIDFKSLLISFCHFFTIFFSLCVHRKCFEAFLIV